MYIGERELKFDLLEQWKIHATHKEKSWAWIYNYNLYCQNALCINPVTHLVKNIGINSFNSTHIQENVDELKNDITPLKFPIRHPVFIGEYKHKNVKSSTIQKILNFRLADVFWVQREGEHTVFNLLAIKFKFKIKRC